MRNRVMKLGEAVMLPAINGNGISTMCKYTVTGKQNGGHYILQADSRFTRPYQRTIHRCKDSRPAEDNQSSDFGMVA